MQRGSVNDQDFSNGKGHTPEAEELMFTVPWLAMNLGAPFVCKVRHDDPLGSGKVDYRE